MQVTNCKEGNQQDQVGGDHSVSGHEEDSHPQGPGEVAPEVKERKEVNDKESSDSLQLILPGR